MTEEEIKEFQDCFTGRPIPRDGVPPAALGCYREHGSTGPYPTFPRPQWKPRSRDCAGHRHNLFGSLHLLCDIYRARHPRRDALTEYLTEPPAPR